ncbi:hypothetical protein G6F56_009754 [Rhizopus delemar]|nr:hypothetical protein G6F56_009754 [Rhizopus delemar]
MLTTTDEINLFRLLSNCENKLKSQSVDLWPASEKRKFATYIKYLSSLQNNLTSGNEEYVHRIAECTKAISLYRMQVEVDKGIAETRLVKRKHLEELKGMEQPEPEWLVELKKQDEQLSSFEQQKKEEQIEKQTKEDTKEEEAKEKETKEEEKKEKASEIRQRNNRKEETFNVEHVLQHHRQMHDELSTDLGRMAQQLKQNSQAFGDTLR